MQAIVMYSFYWILSHIDMEGFDDILICSLKCFFDFFFTNTVSNKYELQLSNKDTSRLANIASPLHTKAFLTLQETLPGVPFNYYGNEIGMIDHPSLPVPWKYRTPMQWNSKGTGFSQNIKWLSNPDNYTYLNVQVRYQYFHFLVLGCLHKSSNWISINNCCTTSVSSN